MSFIGNVVGSQADNRSEYTKLMVPLITAHNAQTINPTEPRLMAAIKLCTQSLQTTEDRFEELCQQRNITPQPQLGYLYLTALNNLAVSHIALSKKQSGKLAQKTRNKGIALLKFGSGLFDRTNGAYYRSKKDPSKLIYLGPQGGELIYNLLCAHNAQDNNSSGLVLASKFGCSAATVKRADILRTNARKHRSLAIHDFSYHMVAAKELSGAQKLEELALQQRSLIAMANRIEKLIKSDIETSRLQAQQLYDELYDKPQLAVLLNPDAIPAKTEDFLTMHCSSAQELFDLAGMAQSENTDESDQKALRFLKQAGRMGHARAQCELVEYFHGLQDLQEKLPDGSLVPASQEHMFWITQLAEQNEPGALFEWAFQLRVNKEFDKAIDKCDECINSCQMMPNTKKILQNTYNLKGALLRGLGQIEQAITNYKAAMNLGTHPAASYNLANIYYDQGLLELALVTFNQSDLPEACLAITVILEEIKEYVQAEKQFALLVQKDIGRARKFVEQMLKEPGDRDRAMVYIKLLKPALSST